MKRIKLLPSILSADFSCLKNEIDSVQNASYLHLDVMDGNFVNNISFGLPVIKNLRKITDMVFDVHLMIDNPQNYIEKFADSGADIITVHYEASKNIKKDLETIRKLGKKACVAIKPKTEAKIVFELMDKLDMILIMTVEPGFGGQKIIYDMLNKIKEINDFVLKNNINVNIEADGGINFENANKVIESGANMIVMGSAIFNLNVDMRKAKINEFYEFNQNR